MKKFSLLIVLFASACAGASFKGPGGELVYANGYTVDKFEYEHISEKTISDWETAFKNQKINCNPRNLKGVRVDFERPEKPKWWGLYGQGLILVYWKDDLEATALAHELSHAILDRCPFLGYDHNTMACMVVKEPYLIYATQMNANQCETGLNNQYRDVHFDLKAPNEVSK